MQLQPGQNFEYFYVCRATYSCSTHQEYRSNVSLADHHDELHVARVAVRHRQQPLRRPRDLLVQRVGRRLGRPVPGHQQIRPAGVHLPKLVKFVDSEILVL